MNIIKAIKTFWYGKETNSSETDITKEKERIFPINKEPKYEEINFDKEYKDVFWISKRLEIILGVFAEEYCNRNITLNPAKIKNIVLKNKDTIKILCKTISTNFGWIPMFYLENLTHSNKNSVIGEGTKRISYIPKEQVEEVFDILTSQVRAIGNQIHPIVNWTSEEEIEEKTKTIKDKILETSLLYAEALGISAYDYYIQYSIEKYGRNDLVTTFTLVNNDKVEIYCGKEDDLGWVFYSKIEYSQDNIKFKNINFISSIEKQKLIIELLEFQKDKILYRKADIKDEYTNRIKLIKYYSETYSKTLGINLNKVNSFVDEMTVCSLFLKNGQKIEIKIKNINLDSGWVNILQAEKEKAETNMNRNRSKYYIAATQEENEEVIKILTEEGL